jgi:alkylation response protein AidB-like acyl-CoA dehydrogenase
VTSAVEAATAVAPLVRSRAEEAEAARRLPDDVVVALRDAGLMRMCVPAKYGGPEVDPLTMMTAIELVAAADGAAGWCTMIASTTSSMASYLPESWAEKIYEDASVISGGAFAPSGVGTAVDGGHRVNGRWAWGSGTQHCQWITGGTLTDRGEFHLMFFPAADVGILDTWYSNGLRGTGSNDFEVRDAFVPDGLSVQPLVAHRQDQSPLSRFPNFSLLACGVAITLVGIAAHAIDEFVTLAAEKTPMLAQKKLSSFATAQIDVAKAEAALGAARAFLHHEVGVAWDLVQAGDPVPVAQRARIRLACSHAGAESARAVDLVYNAGGGSSVYASSSLGRCFRDVHTATQHIMVSPRMLETFGKLRMGIDVDTAML